MPSQIITWLHLSDFRVGKDDYLSALGATTNGGFALAIGGLLGRSVSVQTSTNLVNWQAFTNFSGSTNAATYFEDTETTNAAWRFYRGIVP